MTSDEMDALLTAHFAAEGAQDVNGILATLTEDAELDGIPGENRPVAVRLLHICQFRDGLISRDTIWFDAFAVLAQLGADPLTRPAGHRAADRV